MLPCPRCKVRLKRRAVPGGVAWSCPRCDGRTATFGLLRKGLEEKTLQAITQRAREPEARVGVRCPSCMRGMREVTLRTPDGYQEIDVCTPCTFVWFDPGEFHSVAASVPPAEAPGPDRLGAPLRDPRAVEAMARLKLEQHQEKQRLERRRPDAGWKWLPGLMGMPVEFDDHEPATIPIATWTLVGIVSIVSILSFGDLDGVIARFGFRPSEAWRLGGLTALTAFFLHANWMHLIGNMYFLWIFGDNSEDVLGVPRFLMLLVLATIMGAVLHALMTADPTIPAVGASGGISGIMGYYALRFPRMRVGILIFFIWWWRIPTRIAFALWVALQLYGAFVAEGNIAYMAHLGGALVGVAFWAYEEFLGGGVSPDKRREGPAERYERPKGRYDVGRAHADKYRRR